MLVNKNRFFSSLLIGLLFSISCSKKYIRSDQSFQLYPITQESSVDSAILAFYSPYKSKIDSQMNTVIIHSAKEVVRKKPEGTLNNLVADAMGSVARDQRIKFDFVHTNYKGLRVPFPAGNIKTSKVYELFPFENLLVTITLPGNEVLELFNYMAARGGDPISGAKFKITGGKAVDIFIDNEPLDLTKTYTVLTSDYLANGGDEAEVYKKGLNRIEYDIKVRDAILTYLRQLSAAGKILDPKIDGRIISDKPINDE